MINVIAFYVRFIRTLVANETYFLTFKKPSLFRIFTRALMNVVTKANRHPVIENKTQITTDLTTFYQINVVKAGV